MARRCHRGRVALLPNPPSGSLLRPTGFPRLPQFLQGLGLPFPARTVVTHLGFPGMENQEVLTQAGRPRDPRREKGPSSARPRGQGVRGVALFGCFLVGLSLPCVSPLCLMWEGEGRGAGKAGQTFHGPETGQKRAGPPHALRQHARPLRGRGLHLVAPLGPCKVTLREFSSVVYGLRRENAEGTCCQGLRGAVSHLLGVLCLLSLCDS